MFIISLAVPVLYEARGALAKKSRQQHCKTHELHYHPGRLFVNCVRCVEQFVETLKTKKSSLIAFAIMKPFPARIDSLDAFKRVFQEVDYILTGRL